MEELGDYYTNIVEPNTEQTITFDADFYLNYLRRPPKFDPELYANVWAMMQECGNPKIRVNTRKGEFF